MYASTKRDDDLTCRGMRFARQAAGYRSERGLRILAKREPDLFIAFQVQREAGLRTLEIHARVLARQSDRTIAAIVGLPAPAVKAYTDLFFAVRDRLDARSYITLQVARLHPLEPPTPETLMLLCSYFNGPCTIPAWLDFLEHGHEAHDVTTGVGRQREAIDLLIAVHQLRDDQETRKKMVERLDLLLKLPEISKTRSAEDAVCGNVMQMLSGIAWAQPSEQPSWMAQTNRGGKNRRSQPKPGRVA